MVSGQQARVAVEYQACGGESDPGPFPIPLDVPVEGAPGQNGDRHVLVIDRDNNTVRPTAIPASFSPEAQAILVALKT